MAKALTPQRRKTILLATIICGITPSLILMHHSNATHSRFTVYGILTGLVVGGLIVAAKKMYARQS